VESLSYSARGNVEKIIFRAFSVAVILTGIEIIGNAIFQSSVLLPTNWILVVLVRLASLVWFMGRGLEPSQNCGWFFTGLLQL